MRSVVGGVVFALVLTVLAPTTSTAAPDVDLWDTAWSLPNKATPAEVEQYFDHLAANGFSGAWIMTAPHYWQGGLADENYAGEAMESFSSPNPTYLAHIDYLLDEAAERGLQLALAIAWTVDYAGERPGAQNHPVPAFDDWFDPDDPNVGQKAFDYGFLVGERWGGHPGVYAWVLGGDYWWGGASELLTEEAVVQMAAGLEAAGAPQPVTYGPGGFSSSWHLFADASWVDIVSFNHHCLQPEQLQAELEALAVYGKPVVAAEVRYEADAPPFCDPPLPETSPADIRADVEATVAAGAAGYVYGHHDRWAWDPGVMDSLGSPGELEALDVLGLLPGPEPPTPTSEVVLVEPNGRWHLRVEGAADWTFWFGVPGDVPLFGDWNGDGVATPGMFRVATGFVYQTDQLPSDGAAAIADRSFFYGVPGDQVFVGDWDGDGRDSLGIVRNGKVYLRNSNSTGVADVSFFFGVPGDFVFGGNPDGGAQDELFAYRESSGIVYFVNDLPVSGVAVADGAFSIGTVDGVTSGDWDGDGVDTVGLIDAGIVGLKNTNASGPLDVAFSWGGDGWVPVAGVVAGG
jgi:hypothetical protein